MSRKPCQQFKCLKCDLEFVGGPRDCLFPEVDYWLNYCPRCDAHDYCTDLLTHTTNQDQQHNTSWCVKIFKVDELDGLHVITKEEDKKSEYIIRYVIDGKMNVEADCEKDAIEMFKFKLYKARFSSKDARIKNIRETERPSIVIDEHMNKVRCRKCDFVFYTKTPADVKRCPKCGE